MKNVLLVKDGSRVSCFYSDAEMKAAGFRKADKTVTEEEFNSSGCYARIIDGGIVVGRTAEEIAAQESAEEIAEIDARLAEIDRSVGPRSIRDMILFLKDTAPEIPASIGKAAEKLESAEAEAAPLRARRRELNPDG
jgi:hypothetical protein